MDKFNNIISQCASTFYNHEGHIIFDPPLYVQRYHAAINCLKHEHFRNQINNIVEFGCAEMKFFTFVKSSLADRDLSVKLVDIDEDLLYRCKNSAQPLLMDHVKRREYELNVEIWCGDVSLNNPNFKNTDAVVALELIEHVYPKVLDEIPYQIFANLNPKIAIFSSPNSEYNKVFDLAPGTFRHNDHKFEWTREQFNDWCENICVRFPDYEVKIDGVGKPPIGFEVEKVGYSSQFALFVRKDILDFLNEPNESNIKKVEEEPKDAQYGKPEELPCHIPCDGYKLITSINYPVFKDTRSRREKIIDEVCYHVNRLKYMEEQFYNLDNYRTEIPINCVTQAVWETSTNEEEIADVIRERYQVENNLIIIENDYDDGYEQPNDDYQDENIL